MDDQHNEQTAAEVYRVDLEPRPGGRLRQGARVALAFISAMASGHAAGPSVSDVVVRRRDDGTEVLRFPAWNPDTPGDMLAYVREQLDTRSPEQFLQEWRRRRD